MKKKISLKYAQALIFISIFPVFTFGQTSNEFQKDDHAKIYSQAIAEYIRAVYKKDKSGLDTLFIGKHPDFPSIQLPAMIQDTKVMLLTTDEADKKLQYRKSLVYINMFGWITKDRAEFILVTFFNGYRPQHNCLIDFKYNSKRKEFELDKLRFEYPYSNSN